MDMDMEFRLINIDTDSNSSFGRISDISSMSFEDTDHDTSDFDEEEYRAISLMSMKFNQENTSQPSFGAIGQTAAKTPSQTINEMNQPLASATGNSMQMELQLRVGDLLNTVKMMLGKDYGNELSHYGDITHDIGQITPAFLAFLDNMSGQLQQIEIPTEDTPEK